MDNFTFERVTNRQNKNTLQPGMSKTTAPRILLPDFHPDDEREYESDREYLLQMYPAKARIIMAMIESECDRLEYDGSPMYARYPDKETLLISAAKIVGRICGNETDEELKELIQVMFLNECYNRRNKYRRRRKFY
jgi:hypothetical protein